MQVTHANALGLQTVLRTLGTQLLFKLCPVLFRLTQAMGTFDGSGIIDRRLSKRLAVLFLADLALVENQLKLALFLGQRPSSLSGRIVLVVEFGEGVLSLGNSTIGTLGRVLLRFASLDVCNLLLDVLSGYCVSGFLFSGEAAGLLCVCAGLVDVLQLLLQPLGLGLSRLERSVDGVDALLASVLNRLAGRVFRCLATSLSNC
ncbi:hypothetical protein D3C77_419480 [compost metagenome]